MEAKIRTRTVSRSRSITTAAAVATTALWLTLIDVPGAVGSEAYGVNNAGEVVGV